MINNEQNINRDATAGGFSSLGNGGMHYVANPLIFKSAEELRNSMTRAEELLGNYLTIKSGN